MIVENWFDSWLNDYKNGDVSNSTIEIYRGYLRNYINPKVGKLNLDELTAQRLQDFYNGILTDKGISPKTLRNIHSMIHKSLKKAVRLEIIDKNPSDYVQLPKVINTEINIFTDEEEEKLKNAIKEEYFGIGILVELYTGLRLGELLGLKWSDLNLDKGILKVTHSLSRQVIVDESGSKRKTGLVLHEPKTKSSKREIPLKRILIEELRVFKEKQQKRYGSNINEDFMISNKYMKPIDPRSFQNFFQKMLEKAQIRKVKFHSLRHKFASKAIETGVSDKVTSKLLGHSSVTTTLNIYTHISDEIGRNVIDRM